MFGSLKLKFVLAAAAIGLLVLFSAPAATATSNCGTQNADLTACASLSPDQAQNGDTVTATGCVTNNTTTAQRVIVTATVEAPNGESYTVFWRRVRLAAGETACKTVTYTVQPYFPRGTYELTVSATNRNGTSSATATVTFV